MAEYDDSLPSMPKPFNGDGDEAYANFKTHSFRDVGDGEVECDDCMSKPWHTAAHYPCGQPPPRINASPEKIAKDQGFRVAVGTAMRRATE